MGILNGALSLRRYRAVGELPEDFRSRFTDALNDHAFREPREWVPGLEAVGWCQIHNLLDTEFGDINRWLYNQYLVAALRVDRKSLPANLLKAHLDKKVAAWCEEHGRPKAPARVKAELKEQLQVEMLGKTLPRVTTWEFCWDLDSGEVLFHNTAEKANDLFRKVFRQTFGLALLPWSPLDFLADRPELAAALEVSGLSDLRSDDSLAPRAG